MAESVYVSIWKHLGNTYGPVFFKVNDKAGLYTIPQSLLFYCRWCGGVYGRCIIHKAGEINSTPHLAHAGCCYDCRARLYIPEVIESVWVPNFNRYNNSIPTALLEIEFDKQLHHWEKERENGHYSISINTGSSDNIDR